MGSNPTLSAISPRGATTISEVRHLSAAHDDKSRRWFLFGLRWTLALVVLGFAAYLLPVGALRRALSSISALSFFFVLGVYLVAIALGSLKWHLVVNSAGSDIPLRGSVQAYGGGLFGALFLPSVVGGDAVRLTVGLSHSPKTGSVITGNFADRFLDLGALVALTAIGILLLPGSLPASWRFSPHASLITWLLFGAGILVVFGIFLLLRIYGGTRIRQFLIQLRHSARTLAGHPYRVLLCWLLSILVQMTFLAVTMLLGVSCGLHLPFRVWLLAWPLSKIAALLPITQGGAGVREAALVALLAPFGAPAAQVLATGIASQAVIITGALLAGLCALWIRRAKARGHSEPQTAESSG